MALSPCHPAIVAMLTTMGYRTAVSWAMGQPPPSSQDLGWRCLYRRRALAGTPRGWVAPHPHSTTMAWALTRVPAYPHIMPPMTTTPDSMPITAGWTPGATTAITTPWGMVSTRALATTPAMGCTRQPSAPVRRTNPSPPTSGWQSKERRPKQVNTSQLFHDISYSCPLLFCWSVISCFWT